MKYIITIFVTAVIVFLGATIYYKGLPSFTSPSGVSVVSTEKVDVASPSASPVVEDEDLAKIIKEALVKKYGSESADMKVTVSETEGEYAKGMVTEQGGGGMWLAARLNGKWTLAWDGNGTVGCDDISPFPGIPVTWVPECWDNSSKKLITR